MAPNTKALNAIKHADEYLLVNDKNAAIQCLYDALDSSKNKVWSDSIMEAINKLLDICIDIRESESAKEALSQYRNICQILSPESMTTVVTRYLDNCKQKITEAQTKYGLTDSFHLNLDEDVNPLSVFDDLSLDKEDPKRAEREVIYPLIVFYWDNIRNILELVRINNTMESLYHNVCQRAFEFCTTYNRVNEFHILRRLLHKHLDNLMDPLQDQSSMKFRVVWSSKTAELQLITRFRQLEAACQLQLWQEAFNIVADIRVITSLPFCKSSLRASYFEKLADVFWEQRWFFYHAYAMVSFLAINKRQNKEITDAELAALSGRVLLAALCIPHYSISEDETHPSFKAEREKVQIVTRLLSISPHITRASLLAEMVSLDVIACAPEPLRALYSALECELHPLDMIDCVAPALAWLKEQPELVKYLLPLRQGILLRVLRQLETVYSVMKLDALYALIDALELDRFDAERMVMEASACGQLRLRIDRVARVVLFKENKTECDVLSSYLSTLGAALSVTMAEVNPENKTIEDAYGDLCDLMDTAREVKAELNETMNARAQRVLQKKLERDRLEQDKSLSDAERMRRETQEREEREQARLQEEEARRMEEQMARERKLKEDRDRQAAVAELKKLQGRRFDEKEAAELSLMELNVRVLSARDVAKKEREERVAKDSERQLFLVRALREAALPGLKELFATQHAAEVAYWEQAFETQYEQKKKQNEKLAVLKPVCDRLKDHLAGFATSVATRRAETVKEVVEKRFEEAEEKRKKEEEERRRVEEERRRVEEEKRRVEEEKRRVEEEKRRAEEERRRREEEEERRVAEARAEEERRREEERRKNIMADDGKEPEKKARRRAAPRKAPATASAAPAAPAASVAPKPAMPAMPAMSTGSTSETAPVQEAKNEEWVTVEPKKKGRRAPPSH